MLNTSTASPSVQTVQGAAHQTDSYVQENTQAANNVKILLVFKHVRKIEKRDYWLSHACLPACLSVLMEELGRH